MSQAPLLFDSGRRNLFIEAGAGTGKTTEIVSRVRSMRSIRPRSTISVPAAGMRAAGNSGSPP